MRIPIIILAFDRPDYLRQVLESLRRQAGIARYEVCLFLDGSYDLFNDKIIADEAKINACANIFREFFPTGTLIDTDRNLGIAGNFLRAERYAFEMLGAPYAYFLEDDMILGPNYLEIVSDLAQWTATEPAISTFAAYGLHNDKLETQAQNAGTLTRMVWNWAFGLSRVHWVARHELMRPYYDMVLRGPYRERPTAAIVHWCRTLGWGMISPTIHPAAASSQDSIKTAMSSALGASGLMTRTVHAKYIGAIGTHFNPSAYASHNFADTALYDGVPPKIARPSTQELKDYAYSIHGMRELRGEMPESLVALSAAESPDMLATAYGLPNLNGVDIADLRDFSTPIGTLRAKYPAIDAVVRRRRSDLADLLMPLIDSLGITSITTVEELPRRISSAFYVPAEFLSDDYDGHRPAAPLAALQCTWAPRSSQEGTRFIERCFRMLQPGGTLDLLVPDAEAPDAATTLSTFGATQTVTSAGWTTYRLVRR